MKTNLDHAHGSSSNESGDLCGDVWWGEGPAKWKQRIFF